VGIGGRGCSRTEWIGGTRGGMWRGRVEEVEILVGGHEGGEWLKWGTIDGFPVGDWGKKSFLKLL